MKKIFTLVFLVLTVLRLPAQEGQTVFTYLLLPNSARVAALGGYNVSIVENDVSLIYSNPGFLGVEMDKMLNVNYMSYVGDVGIGSATFAKSVGERGAWGAGFNFSNYGNMIEMTENEEVVGDLHASDICGNLFFGYDLSSMLRGGIAAKMIYSNYYHNTSIGLGVDLGLSYYNEDNGLCIGLAGKNLGRQVKSYETELSDLPWDIQLGLSQKLNHAPIRYSLTVINVQRIVRTPFLRHFVVGLELMPSDNFWIAGGYNARRGYELSLAEGNKMGGFSIGAGIYVKSFSIGCSVGMYHPSATSFMLSLSASLANNRL